MDLTRAVGYRGFNLNSITMDAGSNDMVGCEIRRVDFLGVQGMGYDEKRALMDGYDASDVYLGKRLLRLEGNLYGRTRGEFYDQKQSLIAVFTPTNAYLESPGDRGFLPLDYYEPTNDLVNFPAGIIHKQLLVRPAAQPDFTFDTNTTGGEDGKPLSMPWSAVVEAKDPRVYAYTPTEWDIPANPAAVTPGVSVALNNRGDYPAPINLLLAQDSNGAGGFGIIGAGSDLWFQFAALAVPSIFRYSARDKIASLEVAGVETLRMDMIQIAPHINHPLVPPGQSSINVRHGADIHPATGSRLWYWDSWA